MGERVREREKERGKERESANEGDKKCEVERKREHALAIQRPMFTYIHKISNATPALDSHELLARK